MGFAGAVALQQNAVFRALGEDANWDGVTGPVRVRRLAADQDVRLGMATIVQTGVIIRVRKLEVPAPADGQQVQILGDDGSPLADGLYFINGEPELDRKSVWHCPARQG